MKKRCFFNSIVIPVVFLLLGSLFSKGYAINDPKYPFHPPQVISFESSNLPIVILELDERMADKEADKRVSASMKIIWNKDGGRNKMSDVNYDYNGRVGIKYRGNSSFWNSDKKPFGLQTQNANGKKQAASVLGMGEDTDWALLAPFNDKSLIRDMLLYELMNGALEYVPTGKYCEVVLNGVYQGVYIMVARVRQGEHRININSPTADTGDGLTGGYLLEIDRNDSPGFWSKIIPKDLSGNNMNTNPPYFQFKYPDEEDMSPAQIDYIKSHVNAMENAIAGLDFKDKEKGYRAYLDTVSMYDFYMAQEISKNIDSYRLSTPLYKYPDSRDKRFKFSIWDFNISMGNADYKDGWCPEGWAYNTNKHGPDNNVPWMFKRVLEDELFLKGLSDRWKEHRKMRFSDNQIEHKIDSLVNLLDEAQSRNFQIWNRFGQYVWPNYYISYSWNDEIAFLKKWLKNRTAWLDSQWMSEDINYVVNGDLEATYSRGGWSDTWLSEWITQGNVYATQTPENNRSGKYALSINNNSSASQIITELTPGTYKLSAWVMTLNNPDAFIQVKNYDKNSLSKKVNIANNKREYHLVEIDDIDVDNNHVELVFATTNRPGTDVRLWVDDISFIKKSNPVGNETVQLKPEDEINIVANSARKSLMISIPGEQFNPQLLEIFDVTGRKVYSQKLTDKQSHIEGVFESGRLYIVKVGRTVKKIIL